MKIQISDSRKYLLRFFFFTFCLTLTLLLLSWLGARIIRIPAPIEASSPVPPIVVIDAGHGGEDCGAIGKNGALEKDLNLQISLKLNELLQANGIQTVMTRTEDILLYDPNSNYQGQKKIQDLATRKSIAEQYENVIFVSIHMNAFPQSQYSGLQVYYSPNHASSQKLAQAMQTLIKQTLQPDNRRGIKVADESIYLLDRLNCPAVLVECGFLSNPEECERLSDDTYQRQLALVIGLSVLQNLSLPNS